MGLGIGGLQPGGSVGQTIANLVGQVLSALRLTLTATTGTLLDVSANTASGSVIQLDNGGGINFSKGDTNAFISRTSADTLTCPGTLKGTTRIAGALLEILSQGDSTGTPGTSATLNTGAGRCALAAASGATFTVTNNKVTANDVVLVQIQDADATATRCVVTSNNGNFVVTFNAAATATTKFYWLLAQQ